MEVEKEAKGAQNLSDSLWQAQRGDSADFRNESKDLGEALAFPPPESTCWEEKTDSCKLSSDLHECTVKCAVVYVHTYTYYI